MIVHVPRSQTMRIVLPFGFYGSTRPQAAETRTSLVASMDASHSP
jgi:hypothetical protein